MAQDEKHYRAYLCFGPNCGPKGTAPLLEFVEEELERAGLTDAVTVLPTGCQSHCETGPTMVVYPGPVYYQEMTVEKLKRVVEEHFSQGVPVREYFWNGVRRKITPSGQRAAQWTLPPMTSNQQKPEPSAPKRKRDTRPVDDFKW